MADRAHLTHFVCQREQSGRSGKQLATEINAQPIAHYGNPQIVHRAGQLPDLIFGEELRFVDENTGKFTLSFPGLDERIHIGRPVKRIRIFTDPDPGRDPALAGAVVKAGSQKIGLHPPFPVVVRRLQKHRRFARVHGRVLEIELCHSPADRPAGRAKSSAFSGDGVCRDSGCLTAPACRVFCVRGEVGTGPWG